WPRYFFSGNRSGAGDRGSDHQRSSWRDPPAQPRGRRHNSRDSVADRRHGRAQMKRRIMVVEDDASLGCLLRDNLIYEGFDVALVGDGRRALKEGASFKPDLVLLDVMLPGIDGFEVCRRLSQSPSKTAIIMLTARDQKGDKVQGLRLGADDYITKPFALDELLARVNAVLRRVHPADDSLVLGGLKFDFKRYTAIRNRQKVAFSQREMEVLHYMSER